MSDVQVPNTHKAAVYDKPGSISTKIEDVETPSPGPGEVLINLTHSGVCYSDLGVMTTSWQSLPHPTQAGQIGGHEGVGKVVKLGPGADKLLKTGDRVGVKWLSSACGGCPPCLSGLDGVCFNQKISGYYTPGTFQQYVLGPASYVTPIPDGLDSAQAAPMLCAGITTYAALRKCGAKSGEFVVVLGAGGGLGHLAVQIAARSMGMRVIGIDADEKRATVLESGAEAFIGLSKGAEGVEQEVKKHTDNLGAHACLVCTAANSAYASSIGLLRFGGTVVIVGMPEGDPLPIESAVPQMMVKKLANIVPVAVGNRKEAIECLELAARGLVKSHIRLEKMENLTEVFQEMHDGKLHGRVVLDLS